MNIRLSFFLVIVLILFGGTYLVFQFTDSSKSKPVHRPWLFKVDDNSIKHIQITYDGDTVDYDKKPGSTTWFIQGNDRESDVEVFQKKWSGTPLLLSGPQVNRIVSPSFDNAASYGLDPPRTIVKVTERSGIVYEFHMGNVTPDGENQYTYLIGDPTLFTVPQIWAEVINRLAYEPPYPPDTEDTK